MERYVRESRCIVEKTDEEKNVELLMAIINTKSDLEIANRNFEYAEDEMIDYYLYLIKAYQAKIDYLVKIAKKKGIVLDMINQVKCRYALKEEDVS